jgi:hypothetical protein
MELTKIYDSCSMSVACINNDVRHKTSIDSRGFPQRRRISGKASIARVKYSIPEGPTSDCSLESMDSPNANTRSISI